MQSMTVGLMLAHALPARIHEETDTLALREVFTMADPGIHVGQNEGYPCYVAIKGKVFDVTGNAAYAPGKAYNGTY